MHPREPRRVAWAWSLATVLGAWAVLHGPLLASGLRLVPGDAGDLRLVHLFLEHGWRALGGAPFWDLPMFHPEPGVMAWSEVVLGAAPPYWLARALGAGPALAYALWLLAVTALDAVAMRWALSRLLGASAFAASAGAVLFAAGASVANQLAHPQLLARFPAVFALACAAGALRSTGRARLAFAVGAGALWGTQVLACYYLGWSAALLAGGLLAGAAAWGPTRVVLMQAVQALGLAPLLAAVVGAALVAGPVLARWLEAAPGGGLRTWDELLGILPRAQSWLSQGPGAWAWGRLWALPPFADVPMETEQRLGLGLLTPAACVWGLWRARARPWVRALALLGLGLVLATTLYRGGWSPWRAVYAVVPGAEAVRAVARLGAWLLIPAAVGLALALDAVRARAGSWAAAGLCALVLAEQLVAPSRIDLPSTQELSEALAARVPAGCRAFLLRWPDPASSVQPYEVHVHAAWAAVLSGVPTVNGLSGRVPKGWDLEERCGPSASAAEVAGALERWMALHGQDAGGVCVVPWP